jgi:membrane protein DedA with SNARE-associated domain
MKTRELEMTPLPELLVVFLTSLGFNLIPFAGPSNLFIASNAAIIMGAKDPPTLVAIGFLVALGSALAKSVHYMVTFFVGKHLSEENQRKLDADALKIRRWAAPLLFIAAVSPIPDEPIVIPLGLMKYSPIKFFSVFFSGKLVIGIAGAFLGAWLGTTFSEWLNPVETIALSIGLTIVITVILLKVDFGKLAQKHMNRRRTDNTKKEQDKTAATNH